MKKPSFQFEIPESVQRELAERDAQKEQGMKETVETDVFEVPKPWGNDKRGVPSSILRSALFGVVKRGKRSYLENYSIASWLNTTVKYTGARLMQSDQDVWMACVEACKREGKTEIIISHRELTRISGKGRNTPWVMASIKRLIANVIEVKDGRYTYLGSLIHDAVKDENTGHIALSINPKMLALFGGNVTHIDIAKRQALKTDLSKWLYGYLSSHDGVLAKPHFVKVEKLKDLCGSEIKEIRNFKEALKKSMQELSEQKALAGWSLEKNIVKAWKNIGKKTTNQDL